MAHCGKCHNTFSTAGNFDRHRWGKTGLCAVPRDIGLVQNSRGTWLMPNEKDISEIYKKKET